MLLNRSSPRLPAPVSSGIMGGGGPDAFRGAGAGTEPGGEVVVGDDGIGDAEPSNSMVERFDCMSPERRRWNQPLLRFDFRSSMKLPPLWLTGRAPLVWVVVVAMLPADGDS